MKLIGKPFGYVIWGLVVGTCLGIASAKRTHGMIDVTIGAVLGVFAGYAVEVFAQRRR